MIDAARLFQINTLMTDGIGEAKTTEVFYNYLPPMVGQSIYTQAIWSDTKTKEPKLSWVGKTTVQAQPGAPTFDGRWVWYWVHDDLQAGSASNPRVPDAVRYPLMKYK